MAGIRPLRVPNASIIQPRINAPMGALPIRPRLYADMMRARYSSLADSCTMVRANVVVTPMFKPQAIAAKAKIQNEGWIHMIPSMIILDNCIMRKILPGLMIGITRIMMKLVAVAPP